MTKVAMFCPPYVGGTYTAAARLRESLMLKGYDLRCIGVQEDGADGRLLRRELEPGVEVWQVGPSLPEGTRLVINQLQQEQYRIAVALSLEHVLTANLPRYLPRSIVSIVKVPMMSRAVLVRTQRLAPYTDRIVAVSERIGTDLVQRFGVPAHKVCAIFNGVDPEAFPLRDLLARQPGPLRALYVGRLSDLDKGVLLLPKIMVKVRRETSEVVLDAVGDGGDEAKLAAQVKAHRLEGMLRLLGPRPLNEIPSLLQSYDCLVMPSRMEGCPWALLEGMAAGCVPVVHDIWGSMGTIVEDGVSGFTIPMGNTTRFADRLVRLSRDVELRKRMSQAARDRIEQRFSLAHMAEDYAQAFNEALAEPSTREGPESLEHYVVPSSLKRTWRSYLPRPVKTFARGWMVRLGMPA